jgi:hypothetical protein
MLTELYVDSLMLERRALAESHRLLAMARASALQVAAPKPRKNRPHWPFSMVPRFTVGKV